jgi:hypothetical protein
VVLMDVTMFYSVIMDGSMSSMTLLMTLEMAKQGRAKRSDREGNVYLAQGRIAFSRVLLIPARLQTALPFQRVEWNGKDVKDDDNNDGTPQHIKVEVGERERTSCLPQIPQNVKNVPSFITNNLGTTLLAIFVISRSVILQYIRK